MEYAQAAPKSVANGRFLGDFEHGLLGGLPTDVGGHVQACSLGGTCDRFNLFLQDGNFNNSAYKRWENEIKGALNNRDQVGPVTVRFNRTDPTSARPDSLIIDYSVNGVPKQRFFENKAGK
jgi:filamentous hemagglutinin